MTANPDEDTQPIPLTSTQPVSVSAGDPAASDDTQKVVLSAPQERPTDGIPTWLLDFAREENNAASSAPVDAGGTQPIPTELDAETPGEIEQPLPMEGRSLDAGVWQAETNNPEGLSAVSEPLPLTDNASTPLDVETDALNNELPLVELPVTQVSPSIDTPETTEPDIFSTGQFRAMLDSNDLGALHSVIEANGGDPTFRAAASRQMRAYLTLDADRQVLWQIYTTLQGDVTPPSPAD